MSGAAQQAAGEGLRVSVEIIIPARNEAQRLPAGLKSLIEATRALPCGVAILVVDNASSDRTASIVADWPCNPVPVRLVRCARRGKGAAVRTGLLASRAPLVGYLDADMATDLSALGVAMGLLVSGHRVVIGSRAHEASLVEDRHSWVRALGAAAFRSAARVIVPGVTDTQCGFKFFVGALARAAAASMKTSGFSFDVELLARCRRLGGEVTEIPVRWRDMPGSTFSIPRHAISAFTELAAIWLSLRADVGDVPYPIPIPPALKAATPAAPAQIVDGGPAVPDGQLPVLSPSPGRSEVGRRT